MAKKSRKKSQNATDDTASPMPSKLMPPPARPHTSTPLRPLEEITDGSTIKSRKRKRARKSGQGANSFSEGTSIVSSSTATEEAQERKDAAVESSSRSQTPSGRPRFDINDARSPTFDKSKFRESLSQPEQLVFDKEPERFGVYEFSSDADTASRSGSPEDTNDSVENGQSTISHQSSRSEPGAEAFSSPRASTVSSTSTKESTSENHQTQAVSLRIPDKEKHVSESKTESSADISIPEDSDRSPTPMQDILPQKSDGTETNILDVSKTQSAQPSRLANGRFACPHKNTHDCEKTYANLSDARKHGLSHTEPDRFKCEVCWKALSRKDKLLRHMKIHANSSSQATTQNDESLKDPVLQRSIGTSYLPNQLDDTQGFHARVTDRSAIDVAVATELMVWI